MGTWGNGNFDNDGALDFTLRLTSQDKLTSIEEAFDAILSVDDYIDVDYGEEAVAAAEVVALLRGKPAESLPDSLIEWHQSNHLIIDDALTAKAIQAVEKAIDPESSEFRQLREDGQSSSDDWYGHANIASLLERLRS